MSTPGLTPAQRLAESRAAITAHLQRHQRPERRGPEDGPAGEMGMDPGTHDPGEPSGGGWWRIARRTAGIWWRHHPAHAALEMGRPVLEGYARDKPFQVLGIAAGIGVAMAVLRPWRLLSVGGIVALALKTPDIPGLLASVLAQGFGQDNDRRNPDEHE